MRKYSFSKSAKRNYAMQMEKISNYCLENKIYKSIKGNSYYFTVSGVNYRISNHKSHLIGKDDKIVMIHASKTRIIEIHKDLLAGYKLDGRGNRK